MASKIDAAAVSGTHPFFFGHGFEHVCHARVSRPATLHPVMVYPWFKRQNVTTLIARKCLRIIPGTYYLVLLVVAEVKFGAINRT